MISQERENAAYSDGFNDATAGRERVETVVGSYYKGYERGLRVMAEIANGPYLKRIPHPPANDTEIEDYARGLVQGIAQNITPNVVGSLLARIRDDAERWRVWTMKG